MAVVGWQNRSAPSDGKMVTPGWENKSYPGPIDENGEQRIWVLSEAELSGSIMRPIRMKFQHLVCSGISTFVNIDEAKTHALEPTYYGNLTCWCCGDISPIGEDGEFVWMDGSKVGT